jgi:hypothetical protein
MASRTAQFEEIVRGPGAGAHIVTSSWDGTYRTRATTSVASSSAGTPFDQSWMSARSE